MSKRGNIQVNRRSQYNLCDNGVHIRCSGTRGNPTSHLGQLTSQYSGEKVVSEEWDIQQRQPDVRRPGIGENMACSGNISSAVELEHRVLGG